MSVTLRNVHEKVAKRVPFNCNGTLTGKNSSTVKKGATSRDIREEIQKHILGSDDNYIVYSYDTPIAIYNLQRGWFVNPEKYSVTTSRHMTSIGRGII